ncbi:OmpA family protein [Planobispora siamensis]|uniref:OmpA family protein n=1 Tax=Planobispora siamensis TaxID=936338 RepID=UPI00194E497C|nr:OmpA family protein [Planobispora siamensis]
MARSSTPSVTTPAPSVTGSPSASAGQETAEPTSCPHGELIPAVEIPAVHADPVHIPEATIGGEKIPAATIPGVDIPAQRIPAQCTEIKPAPGGCLGAASIPPVTIPAVEIPGVEIPGVEAGGIKLDPVRAEAVSAEAVHAGGVSTPEVCQIKPKDGGLVPYVIRPYIIRPFVIRPFVIRPYIVRPHACNDQGECIPSVEVPSVEARAVEVKAVEIRAAELKAYEVGKSEVLEGEDTIAFSLDADVLFDFDSAAVKPAAAAELRRIARRIAERASPDATIRIDGHTDSQGEDAYNVTLSRKRAQAVLDWLTAKGGLDRSRLEATGYGETRPTRPNTAEEGRAKNRRVVISTDT